MQQHSPLDSKRRYHNVVSKMMNKGETYSCELGLGQCSSLSSGGRSTENKIEILHGAGGLGSWKGDWQYFARQRIIKGANNEVWISLTMTVTDG